MAATTHQQRPLIIQAIVALFVAGLLAFIDEGAYDFNWAKDPGNWVAVGFYAAALFCGQLFADRLLLRKLVMPGKAFLASILGIAIGLGVPFGIGFLLVRLISH